MNPERRREIKEKRDFSNSLLLWALNPAELAAAYGRWLWGGLSAAGAGMSLMVTYDPIRFWIGFILFVAGFPAFGYGLHGTIALVSRLRSFAPSRLVDTTEEEYKADDPTPNKRQIVVVLSDGRQMEFEEPFPGEFASWIAAVITPGSDVNFSQRTGTKLRKWPLAMYRRMFALFLSYGLVFRSNNNSAPVVTSAGMREFQAHLARTPLPHSDN